MNAYLDIETSYRREITVIGINRDDTGFVQLVGEKISAGKVVEALKGVKTIYTYNGKRFDIPVIYDEIRLDLTEDFKIHDLMHDCWKKNLYGGLKRVEKVLGINRTLKDIDGYDAMNLWEKYFWHKDQKALKKLLKYNEEDVVNLKTLKEKLVEYK